MNARKRWTTEELEALTKMFNAGFSVPRMLEVLIERDESQIRGQCSHMGLKFEERKDKRRINYDKLNEYMRLCDETEA